VTVAPAASVDKLRLGLSEPVTAAAAAVTPDEEEATPVLALEAERAAATEETEETEARDAEAMEDHSLRGGYEYVEMSRPAQKVETWWRAEETAEVW
jgi:hypothetical protein